MSCSLRQRGRDKTHRNWVETRQNCVVGGVNRPLRVNSQKQHVTDQTSFPVIFHSVGLAVIRRQWQSQWSIRLQQDCNTSCSDTHTGDFISNRNRNRPKLARRFWSRITPVLD